MLVLAVALSFGSTTQVFADSETITSVATQSSTTRLGSDTNYHSEASLEFNQVTDPTSTSEGFYALLHFDVSAIKTQVEAGKVVTDAKLRLTHYRNAYSNVTISVKEVDGAWASTPSHRDNLKKYATDALSNPVLSTATISFSKDMATQLSGGTISTNNTLTDYQATIDLTNYISLNSTASAIDIMIYMTSSSKSKVWSVDASSSNMGDTEYSTEGRWATLLSAFGFANDAALIAAVGPALVVEVADPNHESSTVISSLHDTYIRTDVTNQRYNEAAQMEVWNNDGGSKSYGLMSFTMPDVVSTYNDITTITNASLQLITRKVAAGGYRNVSLYDYNYNFSEQVKYETEGDRVTAALATSAITSFSTKGTGGKAITDSGLSGDYLSLSGWTNTIDLTSYINAYTGSELDLMFYSETGGNNHFYTSDAPTSITLNSETISQSSLIPQLTIEYSVGYTLEVSDALAATLCLPFQAQIPSGITAYTLTHTDGSSTVTATQITTGIIPANTPVLINATAAGNYTFNAATTGIDMSETSVTSGALTGQYEKLAFTTENIASNYSNAYVLNKIGDNVGFYKAANGINVNKYRAYLTATNVSAARGLSIVFDDEPTGIEDAVKSEELKVKSYYDLSGRRVENPTKGLYIVRSAEGRLQGKNGKKVIIK